MKILCIGKILLDIVVVHEKRIPPRYAAQEVGSITIGPGGGGAITAHMFARLGHDVTLLAVVGEDRDGEFLGSILNDGGISTQHLVRSPKFHTLKNVVMVDQDGSAHYIMFSDDATLQIGKGLESLQITDIDLVHISTFDQIVSDDGEPLVSWLKTFREKHPKVVVSIDASKLTQYARRAKDIAPLVDYLFGNAVELRKIADSIAYNTSASELATTPADIVRLIASLGVRKSVVMKLGPHGAVYTSGQQVEHCCAYEEIRVRNENGAGDVFCAAALHDIINGRPLSGAMETANAFAGMHVATPFSFNNSSPINENEIIAHAASCERSPPLMVEEPWWQFPQKVLGYGDRFDDTRQFSNEAMTQWIATIKKAADLSPDSKVLDAGCGTGRFAIPLRDGIGCKVVGVDASEEMLRVARKKSADIDWRHADLTRLDNVLADSTESFDCIWMSSVLTQLADELENVLIQLHAHLKPGGSLLVRFMSQELISRVAWYEYFPKAREAASQRCQKVGRVISFASEAGFSLREAKLMEDAEPMSIGDFSQRIKSGGQTWISRVTSEELDECLDRLRNAYAQQEFFYQHPSYLLVFIKDDTPRLGG